MTVVPSGPQWDAMVEAAAQAMVSARYHTVGWERMHEKNRESWRDYARGALLAALRAVTTEPCATCGDAGEVRMPQWPESRPCPDCPQPSFAAPRVLVDLEVLEAVPEAEIMWQYESRPVFAVCPVEAE